MARHLRFVPALAGFLLGVSTGERRRMQDVRRLRRSAFLMVTLFLAGCGSSVDQTEGGTSEAPTQTRPAIVDLGAGEEIPTDVAYRGKIVRTDDGHGAWVTWHEDGTRFDVTISGYAGCSLRQTDAQYDEEIVVSFGPGQRSQVCTMELKASTFAFELAHPVDVDNPPPVIYVFNDGHDQTRTILQAPS